MTYKLTIDKLGGQGMGIGHLDGKVVFVPFTVPGDEVSIRIVKQKKSFIEGAVEELITPSPDRIAAPCPHFGECGGCAHQNMLYEAQCSHKTLLLGEIFRRYTTGGTVLEPLIPSEALYAYRNKMQLQCEEKRGRFVTGFYRFNSHQIVEIKECPLYSDRINTLMKETLRLLNQHNIPAYDKRKNRGIIKDIVIRESHNPGGLLLILISTKKKIRGIEEVVEKLLGKVPDLKGFYLFHNPTGSDNAFKNTATGHPLACIKGEFLKETLQNILFRISPDCFFQVNNGQTTRIINRIKEMLKSGKGLIDAYAGIGTLSLPMAGSFEKILGIEFSKNSCLLGEENASLNGITNYEAVTGDATEVLMGMINEGGIKEMANEYPFLLLDPPRAGLSEEMAALAAMVPFKRILYLSCNPHTQVRDLDRIVKNGHYRVERLIPIDMFPHTFHIECLAVLERI